MDEHAHIAEQVCDLVLARAKEIGETERLIQITAVSQVLSQLGLPSHVEVMDGAYSYSDSDEGIRGFAFTLSDNKTVCDMHGNTKWEAVLRECSLTPGRNDEIILFDDLMDSKATLADEMSLIDNFQARVASVAATAQAMVQHKALEETTPAKCGARARRSL